MIYEDWALELELFYLCILVWFVPLGQCAKRRFQVMADVSSLGFFAALFGRELWW